MSLRPAPRSRRTSLRDVARVPVLAALAVGLVVSGCSRSDGEAQAEPALTVEKVRRGSIKDFRFFTLDERSRDATPYYVDATVRNDGPAGLGGSSLPLLAHADDDVVYPASELVGRFRPCPSSALPKRFLAGASADLCFIYLLPRGTSLRSVDLQPGDAASAVRWRPKD